VLVAKKALAALTRLRQGFNPFKEPEKIRKMHEDKKTLERAFELLGIPAGYDSSMLDYLQRVSRRLQYRNGKSENWGITWIFKK
jgi:hypothetical protein